MDVVVVVVVDFEMVVVVVVVKFEMVVVGVATFVESHRQSKFLIRFRDQRPESWDRGWMT